MKYHLSTMTATTTTHDPRFADPAEGRPEDGHWMDFVEDAQDDAAMVTTDTAAA